MYVITALFAGVTLASLGGGIDLAREDGSVARAVALGALLVTAGLLSTRHYRREASASS
jgi:hypothetical protein